MLECVAVVISLSHITVLLSFLVHANILWLWGTQSKTVSCLHFRSNCTLENNMFPPMQMPMGKKIQRHQEVSRT